jgi:hypothetical protein
MRLLEIGYRGAAIIALSGLACGASGAGASNGDAGTAGASMTPGAGGASPGVGGSAGAAGPPGTACTTNMDCSTGALPSGPCRSQEDCGGASFADVVFCEVFGCGGTSGNCTPKGQGCPAFYTPVCGCNGKDYYCAAASHGEGVSVDYLGHCDNGSVVSCDETHACPAEQTCFDDPRAPCLSGGSCPGICLATYGYPCGAAQPLDGGAPTLRCTGGFCAVPRASVCDGGECAVCAAGQIRCDQGTTCPEHQVCIPSVGCGAATCPSYCVRL